MSDAAPLVQSALLAARAGIVHGFTTRAGGVSEGPLGSLNLARRPGEDDERLRENWRRAAASCGRGLEDLVLLGQVHGATVLTNPAPSGPLDVAGDADAAVSTEPGVLLTVRGADCVPILIAAPGGVAVAHSGWRGTAQNVVAACVGALATATGEAPATFAAAIGPCISAAAYEVGGEVVDGLTAAGLDPTVFLREDLGARPHVDLGAAVASQLRAAGVGEVDVLGLCTLNDERFYSHRQDPQAGRQVGLIGLSPPSP